MDVQAAAQLAQTYEMAAQLAQNEGQYAAATELRANAARLRPQPARMQGLNGQTCAPWDDFFNDSTREEYITRAYPAAHGGAQVSSRAMNAIMDRNECTKSMMDFRIQSTPPVPGDTPNANLDTDTDGDTFVPGLDTGTGDPSLEEEGGIPMPLIIGGGLLAALLVFLKLRQTKGR